MKKTLLSVSALLVALLLALFAFSACDSNEPEPGPTATTYTVTFKDGDTVVKTVTVESGKAPATADLPADPTLEGYTFGGWYKGETAFDPTAAVSANVTYTARWNLIRHTVTFKDGETVLKTVTVTHGGKIAANYLPDEPQKAGNTFEGWYNGNNAFSTDTVYNADATYTAKWTLQTYTVTFMNGDEVVATPSATYGHALEAADLPSNPSKPGYRFDGWYNGETAFVEDAPVTENVTYTAKWTKNAFFVTFVNGEDSTIKYVAYPAEGTAVLGTNIADDVTGTGLFLGWYNGAVKAEATTEITEDITFTATFVSAQSYTGAWLNFEEKEAIFFYQDGSNYKASFRKQSLAGTYNATTGAWTYQSGSYSNRKTWTLLALGDVLQVTYGYYDSVEEDFVNEVILFNRGEAVEFAGEYRKDNSGYLTVLEGGVVARMGSSSYTGNYFAVIRANGEGGYTLYVKENDNSAMKEYAVSMDAAGNIAVDNAADSTTCRGIYIKNATAFKSYYCSDNRNNLYVFTVDGTPVYTFKTGNTNLYYFAALSGEIADGAILNVTYGETTDTIQISGTSMLYAGAEKGTYTNGTDTLVLDGFGNATLNGTECEYQYMEKTKHVYLESGGCYTLNATDSTYAPVTSDGFAGSYTLSGDSKYTLILTGYGDALLHYQSTYSSTDYVGTYTVSGTTLNIKDCSYSYNGDWTLEEAGNVLVKINSTYVFVKDGYEVTSHKAEMDGTWIFGENTLVVNSEANQITLNGVTATIKYNYNGTIGYFTVKYNCPDDMTANASRDFTIKRDGDNLIVSHQCATGFDDDGYLDMTEKSDTYTLKPASEETDDFAGTWKQDDGSNTVVFDGKGIVTYNGTNYTYTIVSGKATFNNGGYDCTCTITDAATGKMSIYFDDGYGECFTQTFTKEAEEVLDDFAGTWKRDGSTITAVFDGKGTVVYNGSECQYTVGNDGKATFELNYETYICTITGTGTMRVEFTYDYEVYTANFTKQ